jgi:hypothetical protein
MTYLLTKRFTNARRLSPFNNGRAGHYASFNLIQLDTMASTRGVDQLDWLYSFGPGVARAILSAISRVR